MVDVLNFFGLEDPGPTPTDDSKLYSLAHNNEAKFYLLTVTRHSTKHYFDPQHFNMALHTDAMFTT
jgi:hypothetical protein